MPVFNPSGIRTVLEDNANVVTGTQSLDFTEPDTMLVTNPSSGLARVAVSGYALLIGRAGGQTLIGDKASGGNLTLQSTSNATRGKILLDANSAYDELNVRLGIATQAPSFDLSFGGSSNRTVGIETPGSGVGAALTVKAGDAFAGTGGALTLKAGDGAGVSNGGATLLDSGTGAALPGPALNIGTSNAGQVNIGRNASLVKLGFFGVSAVVKPVGTTDLRTSLINLGLYTGGGATPLNLNGGALTVGSIAATGTVALTGDMTISDGINIVLNTTTGTKIGTATSQKLGFFNATPVVQEAGSNDVLASLVTLGLRAASSNPPLNLGSGTLTAGIGTFSGLATMNAGGLLGDNDTLAFGDASDATIKYDGTDLIIDPKVVGSGKVDLNGANFKAQLCAFGGAAGNTAFVVHGDSSTSTVTRGFSATITYTGASAAMRSMSFTADHQGSSSSASPVSALLDARLSVAATGSCSAIGASVSSTLAASITAGTKTMHGVKGSVLDAAGGHSGASVVHAASIVGLAPDAFTGFGTINRYAGLFDFDVQLSTGSKLILEGGLTTKGDSYLAFNTTTANKIQVAIDNAVVIDFRAATMNLVDPYDMVLGTTTGTKIGTATSQKLGFWNKTPIIQPAAALQAAITNSTGGTQDGTLVDVGVVFSQANINNNFTDVFALLDAMRTALVNSGIMKGAA